MRPINPRRAAAVGTLVCALGAAFVMCGLGLRADAPPAPDDLDPLAAAERGPAVDSTATQNQDPSVRSIKVTARRYRFDPGIIEVFQDEVVKVELHADDIAHSLTIDAYRIAKRASPAGPVTFEFRADQAGTFPYYCNLQIDDGCRQMRGQLVVKPRR
jgi:plastocyanin